MSVGPDVFWLRCCTAHPNTGAKRLTQVAGPPGKSFGPVSPLASAEIVLKAAPRNTVSTRSVICTGNVSPGGSIMSDAGALAPAAAGDIILNVRTANVMGNGGLTTAAEGSRDQITDSHVGMVVTISGICRGKS